jgi:hypothetical protein
MSNAYLKWQYQLPLTEKRIQKYFFCPMYGTKQTEPWPNIPVYDREQLIALHQCNKLDIIGKRKGRSYTVAATDISMGESMFDHLFDMGITSGARKRIARSQEDLDAWAPLGAPEAPPPVLRPCRNCGVKNKNYFYCHDCSKGARKRSMYPDISDKEKQRMSQILEGLGGWDDFGMLRID